MVEDLGREFFGVTGGTLGLCSTGRAGPMTTDQIAAMVREVQGLGPMSPLEFQAETAKLRAYAVRRRRERERERDRSGPDFEREKSL